MKNQRIKGDIVSIDSDSINNFFHDRLSKYNPEKALTAVLYQDLNPQIAIDRDSAEKEILLPLMNLNKHDNVLDIGCGIGRWAKTIAPLVSKYHGTDMMAEFIEIAQNECSKFSNTTFQTISAQDINASNISGNFSLILISGLLIYLNDEAVKNLFYTLSNYIGDNCRILIREPIAIEERLTLSKIWSEELGCEYSAIYRTKDELMNIVSQSLNNAVLVKNDLLFGNSLNNRVETKQYYFLYKITNHG